MARHRGMPIGQPNSATRMSFPIAFLSSGASSRSHSFTGSLPFSVSKNLAGSILEVHSSKYNVPNMVHCQGLLFPRNHHYWEPGTQKTTPCLSSLPTGENSFMAITKKISTCGRKNIRFDVLPDHKPPAHTVPGQAWPAPVALGGVTIKHLRVRSSNPT
jgi:hypothetical protein